MGLHKFKPIPSGRMGTLSTLASIRDAALIEYGCMGHMLYGRRMMDFAGVTEACKLYSTHIDETDISLGDCGRLERAITEIIEHDKPGAVFLLPSAIPTMIGTDLSAVCKEVQSQYPGIRLLPFHSGGFDVFGYRGVQETLLLLAQTLPQDVPKTPLPTYNLIGSCADMFRFQADANELVRIMDGAFGIKPLCVMTSDTSVSRIEQMGGAHFNLVIRREGEPAAIHLNKRFGTPYLLARPYGITGTVRWIAEVAELSGLVPDCEFIKNEEEKSKKRISSAKPFFEPFTRSHPEDAAISLGGHADVVKGILAFAQTEFSLLKGTCWCDCPDMATGTIPYYTENEWAKVIQAQKKGILMASGEALKWFGRNMAHQIANPDTKWRLNPYEPPLVGFRGAIHLASLWINAMMEEEF